MLQNYLKAQNTYTLVTMIENDNWLDTATYLTKQKAIKQLLIDDSAFDTLEWKKTDTVTTFKIDVDIQYLEGTYEVDYSKSNLQKKLWLIECIIAGKKTKQNYIYDKKRKKILLDYVKNKLQSSPSKREREAKKSLKKILVIYRNYFTNKQKNREEFKSPLSNSVYIWINPYLN